MEALFNRSYKREDILTNMEKYNMKKTKRNYQIYALSYARTFCHFWWFFVFNWSLEFES